MPSKPPGVDETNSIFDHRSPTVTVCIVAAALSIDSSDAGTTPE